MRDAEGGVPYSASGKCAIVMNRCLPPVNSNLIILVTLFWLLLFWQR